MISLQNERSFSDNLIYGASRIFTISFGKFSIWFNELTGTKV